jgi:putative acetyltransferase
MDPLITLRVADPAHPQVAALITAHIAYGDAHYAAESNHHLSIEDHAAHGVSLWTAWSGEACLGMAGLKPFSDTDGELKSMHVLPAARGQRVGLVLVEKIVEEARGMGLRHLWLETGSREASAVARALYAREGFVYCPPFAHYKPDPESVFMTLAL